MAIGSDAGPTADDISLSIVIALVRQADWPALQDVVSRADEAGEGDGGIPAGDRAVLDALATGQIYIAPEGTPTSADAKNASPPSPALIAAISETPAALARLAQVAHWAQTAGHLPLAIGVLRFAIVCVPQQIEIRLLLARSLHASGDLAGALAEMRAAYGAAPDHAGVALAYGELLAEAGNATDAELVLSAAAASHPGVAQLHWYLALQQIHNGHLIAAEASLRDVLRLMPDLDDAAFELSGVLMQLDRLQEALPWAQFAATRDKTPERQERVGWLQFRCGLVREAVHTFQAALVQRPASVEGRWRLATVLQRLGRDREAMVALDEGLALIPDDRDLLLALGWHQYRAGRVEAALETSERLVGRHPGFADGWNLKGHALETAKQLVAAEESFAEAFRLDPKLTEALYGQVALLRQREALSDAEHLLLSYLDKHPDEAAMRLVLAQLLLDRQQGATARRHLLLLLSRAPRDGTAWQLLGFVLMQMERPMAARRVFGRAVRLGMRNAYVWAGLAHAALATADVPAAQKAVERLLPAASDNAWGRDQAIILLAELGDLTGASRQAELAVSLEPEDAEAWCALAKIRSRQRRLGLAEDAAYEAVRLAPEHRSAFITLGWVLFSDDRPAEAELAFLRAVELAPKDAEAWRGLAQARHRSGRLDDAVAAAETALCHKPDLGRARIELAGILLDRGAAGTTAVRAQDWPRAVQLLRLQLIDRRETDAAARLLLRLMALGEPAARAAVPLLGRQAWLDANRGALLEGTDRSGCTEYRALADNAADAFPEDLFAATARFYSRSFLDDLSPAQMGEWARSWYRQMALHVGVSARAQMPRPREAKLRIAYVAAHFHGALLRRVLAAHDLNTVDVFLYSDIEKGVLGPLADRISLHPLKDEDLARSCAVNRIDVVIDTMGVQPFHGQIDVLRQFTRRVAPVQCAWLGSWGSSGGLYDVLLTDDAAVPVDADGFYQETIVRLPGGQWCWEPPQHAPEPGPLPCISRRGITFGSSVRGIRLSHRTLTAWAKLLACLPEARLLLAGEHRRDWPGRAEFAAVLAEHGVDPARVAYRGRRPYEEHLAFYAEIDICLDAFPSNGGLVSLDALWMGVPVITRAGRLIGERQGASLLTALGHDDWIADSDEDYIARAVALATDRQRLAEYRRSLRSEMQASSLTDGRRMAAAIEDASRSLSASATEIAAALTPKDYTRALARRSFDTWATKGHRLDLTCPELERAPPDLSVVIVLFNQAGLSLACLAALADQKGVRFETIVVDNGSTDRTADLLARVEGVRVLSNPDNPGFLLAANQAAAQARGRHILFLNNDAIVQDGCLERALHRLEAEPDVDVVGARVVLGNGLLQEAGCIVYGDGRTVGYGRGRDPFAAEYRFRRDVDFCSGAFLMVRRSAWEALGGFDTVFAPAYYEDADLCLRVWQQGARVVYEPDALVSHLEYGSASSDQSPVAAMECREELFRTRHAAWLASRPGIEHHYPVRDRWLQRSFVPRILVVDNAVPHVAIGGGLPRARQLLEALADYDVTLYPLWDRDEDWREVYRTLPANIEVMAGLDRPDFEEFLEQRRGVYTTLVVSRPPNMARVADIWYRRPDLFDGMRIVYDAEAIFALREIRQAAVLGQHLSRRQARRQLKRELALARGSSRVLAVSRREALFFRAAGQPDVRVLCHGVSTRRDVPDWGQRHGLLFVGALVADTPNEDGLLWLIDEVLPIVDRLMPGEAVTLDIVGECRSAKLAARASDRIRLMGRLDDLTPAYDRSRIFLAPARFAAGVPAKVIEAAGNGIPVVASKLLVRQLAWQDGVEIRSGRDPETFAASIVALYRDADLWRRLQQAALDRCEREYDPDRFRATLLEAVADTY